MKKMWNNLLKTGLIFSIVISAVFGTYASTTNAKKYDKKHEEEVLLASVLELIYESGKVTDEQGNIIGYDKKVFEKELKQFDSYKTIIKEMETAGLFVDNKRKGKKNSNNEDAVVNPAAAGCVWHGMKEKPEYIATENECIYNGIKSAYGPVTIASTIANLIADKEFVLAAKKIIALGIRSNIAGIIVTLASIQLKCAKEMDKKFPGKSNCM